ncbi:MAG: class I adenylate-forming enzyme family protein [Pseudomonadota bacterium]
MLDGDALVSDGPVLIEDDGTSQQATDATQLRAALASVQQQLLSLELDRGSVVGIVAPLGVAHLVTLLAAVRAGLVVVPINLQLEDEALRYVLRDAGVVVLLTESGSAPPLVDVKVVEIDFEFAPDGMPPAVVPVAAGDTAVIMYTSGSTGRPKGVPISHGGYCWAFAQFAVLRDTMARRTGLVAAPLFHMNGQFHLLNLLSCGARVVLLRSFSAAGLLSAIERHQVYRATGVPTMYALAAAHMAQARLAPVSCVQMLALGSAPLSQALHVQLQQCFPRALITNGYGTTETGPVSFGAHPDGRPTPPTALGYPMPGVELKLVDGDREDRGTLWLKNPMTLRGYLNRPEATVNSVRDGWYVTGDVLERDAEGFYYFAGRDDDMMQVGGENLYPREVEARLESHPAVAAAAVVPVADAIKAEKPVAFVVLHDDKDVTAEALRAHCLANGPAFAHPRSVYLLEALPLAATNKVDRALLTQWAARRQRDPDSGPTS